MKKEKKIELMQLLCGWNGSICDLLFGLNISPVIKDVVVINNISYNRQDLNAKLIEIYEAKISLLNNRDILLFMNDIFRKIDIWYKEYKGIESERYEKFYREFKALREFVKKYGY